MSAPAIVWIARDLDYMLLVRRCFRQRGVENPIVLLTSGELAISFLQMETSCNPLPLVVIIEISLPQMDGYELLRGIRADSRISNVPVLLLGSTAQLNTERAREFTGVHLAHKPALDEIPELVNGIIERWVPV